jgi:hypothetical protein
MSYIFQAVSQAPILALRARMSGTTSYSLFPMLQPMS